MTHPDRAKSQLLCRPNVMLTGVAANATITAMTTSDPPVPGAYLHPTTAQSLRELLASRTFSVGDLAHMTGVPADTMRDAIQGRCPLEIGMWKAVATVLNANHAQFSITTGERNGTSLLELYCVWA